MVNTDRGKGFWFLWVIGNTAGWILGVGGSLGVGVLLTGYLDSGSTTHLENNVSGLVGVAATFLLAIPFTAILVSVAQWLIIRYIISKAWGWAIATFFGILIGSIAAVAIGNTLLSWIAFGGILGILQMLALRNTTNRAGNWLWISILAGAFGGIAGMVFTRFFEMRRVVSTMGVMFSAILVPPIAASLITGFGLFWILQQGLQPLPAARMVETQDSTPPVVDEDEQAEDWLEELINGGS